MDANTILHYGGQEIPVNDPDAQLVINAMTGVNRGVSECVMLSNGWTLLVAPGIPVALHTPQEQAASVGSFWEDRPGPGPAPLHG